MTTPVKSVVPAEPGSEAGQQSQKLSNVAIGNIKMDKRIRSDLGDIVALARSITTFGIIQPIVLARGVDGTPVLVAGGRRLAALRRLGRTTLEHIKDFVWKDEDAATPVGNLRVRGMELEENIRRKSLHWAEELRAKAQLFEIMQSIHGVHRKGFGGGKSRGLSDGFSMRKLAEMLNENVSTTSRDLELASYVARHPLLAKLPTKVDAIRKLGVAIHTVDMQNTARSKTSNTSVQTVSAGHSSAAGRTVGTGVTTPATVTPVPALAPQAQWKLYPGRFQDSIGILDDASVDLICTDLPYGILGATGVGAAHSAGLAGFTDSGIDIPQLCVDTAAASWRILRPDRFAVFFYGMNYHEVLRDALTNVGFIVDPYPFIWIRDRSAPPDGFARYSKTYDPALVASKGAPRFIRPNQPNSTSIVSVRGPERLHSAQKPVSLMQKFIEDMTIEGCTVCDMFAGVGTTGVAALQTKRRCILFESEPGNCLIIKSRLGAI